MFIFKKTSVPTAFMCHDYVIHEDVVWTCPSRLLHDGRKQIFQLLIFKECILLFLHNCTHVLYIFKCN
jgi:hypothetical protein